MDSFSANLQPGQAKRPVVEIKQLRKTYRTGFWLQQKINPMKGYDLTIYEGETFGLLGPNGAGKTTLLKTLLGLVRPTAGTGLILGHPIGDRRMKETIGYLPENPYFYDYLTGWEFLEFTAGLFRIPRTIQKQRIPVLLEMVGLSVKDARKKQMRRYSKGMLQRVGMAQALINDPELVFLDEPMSGLDPLGRYQVREIILSLKKQGKTIFFNSHVLSDVEAICDRVGILHQGELICEGGIDQLLGSTNTYHVEGRGGHIEGMQEWLKQLEVQGDRWQGIIQESPERFLTIVKEMGGQVLSLKLGRPSLEEFFVDQLRQRGLVIGA
ncbi:ABC transporter ATP-binding protein [Synechococcus sp. PCC 6312]|uniref:ABC transporter ATP-binding protein n=1 Tax=Synechococcus sp. (strain ATCC 27167 / PCC 6312) TaxID=195253 RepID=UPI00029EF4A0|nr:ABC transporter ATP-binding protein [Synechococcus sp. PCC 6312]AFY62712.1 ABC-type multidrug transport system, ATPase component [Synechococcus sp. PCC 6312]